MLGIEVETMMLLARAQAACLSSDPEIAKAGESVLSALVVVLKHPKAELPPELAPHIKILMRR